ncbi:MAG: anaerobic ribonucleoside-triphosphate reductase activating protein [Fibrobacteria bacterium]|nr:anaerobic ribonucleoside-triphosphate reductase activating protein [Fibrobacteria bacterium]
MKIAGWKRTSLVDFPGVVSCVLFTKGCNFRCPWCHNKGLLDSTGEEDTAPMAAFRLPASRKGKVGGVVITGGEPTVQTDLEEFLETLRPTGLSIKLDTNGSNPRCLERILGRGLVDYVALDLKAPWDRYDEACGVVVDTEAIRDSIRLLQESAVAHHLRTTDWAVFDEREREAILRAAGTSPHRWQVLRSGHRAPQAPPPQTDSIGLKSENAVGRSPGQRQASHSSHRLVEV